MNEISNLAKKLRDCVIDDENEIRTLNSDINSLLKEKYKWECRIVELGGPNYKSHHSQYIESLGGIPLPNSSLKIFGAAISLPEYEGVSKLDDKPVIDSRTYVEPSGTIICDNYYREINQEEEDKIKQLEKEKEIELKKERQHVGQEISVECVLKLIRDKKKEICASK